ncbi:MAG TPA: Kv2 voltage-gated K+ channel [Caudoviricetes sp.]|nr:MAG TPA: Kv2 voltage-gated K+ channel [Caudoviricetes sp.]
MHALERGTSADPTEKKILSAQKLETAYNDMALALSEY